MSNDWDTVVDAYLHGDLSPDKVRDFELQLSQAEVAQAFSEALMLRELLMTAPPEEIPEGLLEEITLAVSAQRMDAQDTPDPVDPDINTHEPISVFRSALAGLGWLWRGPVYSLSRTSGSTQAWSGVKTVRYALGPLHQTFSRSRTKDPKSKNTRLRRLSRLWRKRS